MAGKPDELWCPKLSLEDTTALKAAAMFLIVAHNFLHSVHLNFPAFHPLKSLQNLTFR